MQKYYRMTTLTTRVRHARGRRPMPSPKGQPSGPLSNNAAGERGTISSKLVL